jgi:hypothetical protein
LMKKIPEIDLFIKAFMTEAILKKWIYSYCLCIKFFTAYFAQTVG